MMLPPILHYHKPLLRGTLIADYHGATGAMIRFSCQRVTPFKILLSRERVFSPKSGEKSVLQTRSEQYHCARPDVRAPRYTADEPHHRFRVVQHNLVVINVIACHFKASS